MYFEFVYTQSDNFGPKMAFRTKVSHNDIVESFVKELGLEDCRYISFESTEVFSVAWMEMCMSTESMYTCSH